MKPGGAIVNVSSIHATETTPLVASYSAAKAALLALTRSAAIDTPMLWDNPNIKSGLETINASDVSKPEMWPRPSLAWPRTMPCLSRARPCAWRAGVSATFENGSYMPIAPRIAKGRRE